MRKLLAIFILLANVVICSTTHAQRLANPPRDGIYDLHDFEAKKAIPYSSIRESDVIWRKRIWRIIDIREKLNLPFKNPQKPFVQLLIDGVKSGELKAYDPGNDSFTYSLSPANLQAAIGGSVDTVDQAQPDGTTIRVAVAKPFRPELIVRFRIKEDWVFDKQTSTMQVRILGICPMQQVVDDQGNIRPGEKAMFWIYFPECRDYFASKASFNEQNSALPMSWDDLFQQRKFSSYIYKEDNVYDRRVQDYASGIDALLESDRIKNVIFDWEHDVWSF